ncbi:MAG TPA: thrombospondin type 3 repeat-containing protein [Candidatus Thalassarchaeaceae archaeon]|nr:thrombospondin type 3 repeat-containing protein [Candidatus Thalassarchaeaceae archaeon]
MSIPHPIWANEGPCLFPIVIRWGLFGDDMPARGERYGRILAIAMICAFLTPTIFLFPSVSAEGESTLYVDAANCPNAGNGTNSNPYCSINDAVMASSSGDTIEVANGTYVMTSSIEINHPLAVTGAQDGNSALQRTSGDSSESVIDFRGSNNKILIMSSDVSISGFDIHGDEDTRCGIYVAGGSNNISNIEISDNLIHGMAKKIDSIRATSWGILTDAVENGQILHTIEDLHIHGNHIYDIGGYNDSIGLGISIHEVVSSEVDGGALIENNRFSNINDGKWAGAAGIDVPGMAVFTHEQTSMYPGDYLSGISLRDNEYANVTVGAALQISNAAVFDEHSGDFENVDVFLINVGHTTSVNESNLAPFAKSVGKNTSIQPPINVGESTAYFASPSLAVRNTLLGSEMEGHSITLSDGTFDETLVIQPTTMQGNMLITRVQDSNPTFTGGLLLQSNYMMNNITIEGITLQGEGATDVAMSVEASAGISDLTIREMTMDGSNANGNQRSGIIASGLAGVILIEGNHFNDLDGAYAFTSTPDGLDPGAGQISALQFSDNTIIDSESSVNIAPSSGIIPQVEVSGNSFTNSGLNSTSNDNSPMITVKDVSTLYIGENVLQNIHSAQGIYVEDVRYITVDDNNLSGMDAAIIIEESMPNTLQQVTFQGNSFTQIDSAAIEVPSVTGASIQVNQNWFGTGNESEIYALIQGDAEIGEQWNSWPGIDSDNDGWSDEFDLCPGHNDAVDVDSDGIPDGCDSLLDNDGDTIANWLDNCPSIANADQANHDGDLHGDICDDNDDNDQRIDELDSCPLGDLGWAPTNFNDYDNDGCYDMNEDLDDDGDGVDDVDDLCATGMYWGWTSNATNDLDGDGCKDSLEDSDDDGDGIDDGDDNCPLGDTGWISDGFTDSDGDGCRDVSEDSDDDGDGIEDSLDDCPLVAVNNVSDSNHDGCIDAIVEPSTPFLERFLQGDPITMVFVLIPLLVLFMVGFIVYVRQGRGEVEQKLRDMIESAETPIQLGKVSTRASDLYLAKIITSLQHDVIQGEINSRREGFDEGVVDASDHVEKELSRVFLKAVALGLTTNEAVTRMERNVAKGRFEPEHYLEMWTKRIEESDLSAAVDEVIEGDPKKDDPEFTLSTPSGWPTSKSSKPASKPSMSSLNRMKKAELVALAKEQGVSHSGTKAQIIDAIREEEE